MLAAPNQILILLLLLLIIIFIILLFILIFLSWGAPFDGSSNLGVKNRPRGKVLRRTLLGRLGSKSQS